MYEIKLVFKEIWKIAEIYHVSSAILSDNIMNRPNEFTKDLVYNNMLGVCSREVLSLLWEQESCSLLKPYINVAVVPTTRSHLFELTQYWGPAQVTYSIFDILLTASPRTTPFSTGHCRMPLSSHLSGT